MLFVFFSCNASLTSSSSADCAVLSVAADALLNNPFSPVNVTIVTPAKIKSTIIVTTNAIKVIPDLFFKFITLFIFFPPFFF